MKNKMIFEYFAGAIACLFFSYVLTSSISEQSSETMVIWYGLACGLSGMFSCILFGMFLDKRKY